MIGHSANTLEASTSERTVSGVTKRLFFGEKMLPNVSALPSKNSDAIRHQRCLARSGGEVDQNRIIAGPLLHICYYLLNTIATISNNKIVFFQFASGTHRNTEPFLLRFNGTHSRLQKNRISNSAIRISCVTGVCLSSPGTLKDSGYIKSVMICRGALIRLKNGWKLLHDI